MAEEVKNRQIILKDYVEGFPTESDMILRTSTIKLEVPEGCDDGVLVKNLYLSCDPYMRSRMSNLDDNYISCFTPSSTIIGQGVCQVVDSKNPNFKKGDMIWAVMTGWEDYTLHKSSLGLHKIHHTDVPLSYYAGILGQFTCHFRHLQSWTDPCVALGALAPPKPEN